MQSDSFAFSQRMKRFFFPIKTSCENENTEFLVLCKTVAIALPVSCYIFCQVVFLFESLQVLVSASNVTLKFDFGQSNTVYISVIKKTLLFCKTIYNVIYGVQDQDPSCQILSFGQSDKGKKGSLAACIALQVKSFLQPVYTDSEFTSRLSLSPPTLYPGV